MPVYTASRYWIGCWPLANPRCERSIERDNHKLLVTYNHQSSLPNLGISYIPAASWTTSHGPKNFLFLNSSPPFFQERYLQIKDGICKLSANGLVHLNYYKPVRKYHVLIKTKIMIMKRTQFGVNVILIKCVWARVLKNGINGNHLVLFHTARLKDRVFDLIWVHTQTYTCSHTQKHTCTCMLNQEKNPTTCWGYLVLLPVLPPPARLPCHRARFFVLFFFLPQMPQFTYLCNFRPFYSAPLF